MYASETDLSVNDASTTIGNPKQVEFVPFIVFDGSDVEIDEVSDKNFLFLWVSVYRLMMRVTGVCDDWLASLVPKVYGTNVKLKGGEMETCTCLYAYGHILDALLMCGMTIFVWL